LPLEVFDGIRSAVLADRSQFWKDLTMAFYGYNRPGAKISEGVRESFWHQRECSLVPSMRSLAASRPSRTPSEIFAPGRL